jgi:hypothetical protein
VKMLQNTAASIMQMLRNPIPPRVLANCSAGVVFLVISRQRVIIISWGFKLGILRCLQNNNYHPVSWVVH